jgi:acyl-coenzyme A synthetase/AMP-(fatty) acid ligase
MSTELLSQHAPGAPVVFGERGERTCAQLLALADGIRREMRGLHEGQRVVVVCRDRYFFLASMLACLAAGRPMLLPDSATPGVLESLRQRHPVGAVLSDGDEPGAIDVRALERLEAESRTPFTSALALDDVAFVAFTSGSTGEPTPHEKTLGQLVYEAASHVRAFGLGGARFVSAVPAQHIYGLLFTIMAPLLGGGSVVRETALFPAALAELITRHRAAVLVAVPAHLSGLAQLPGPLPESLTRIFSSAGPLPPATAAELRAKGTEVSEILGSTETGGIAHRSADGAPFTPLPGVDVSTDEEGVLHVSAPWLAPAALAPGTRAAARARTVRTADRVELVPGGFRHLGRADTVVKVGGRRVDLQDVEAQLGRVPGVTAVRVLPVDGGPLRGMALWAVVAGEGVGPDALKQALATRFAPVTWPRRFRFVSELPRSATGKVRHADLLALFERTESSPPEAP